MSLLLLLTLVTSSLSSPAPQRDGSFGLHNKPEKCKCITYYNCTDVDDGPFTGNQQLPDPSGSAVIDIRLGPSGGGFQGGGECPNVLEVCCKRPGIPDAYKVTPKPVAYNHKCGSRQYDQETPLIDIRVNVNRKKHGFKAAQFGAYPWMAAILKKVSIDGTIQNVYHCGGSLIHPNFILTSAHCVYDLPIKDTVVRLGEWNTNTAPDHLSYTHQDYPIDNYIMHYNYNHEKRNLWDSIAVIKLKYPADLDYHIDTICLPRKGLTSAEFEGRRCYSSGWGKDSFGKDGVWQTILKEVDLPVWNKIVCQNKFKEQNRTGCRFCLHDTFVCAGGEPLKDTCEGDGGSPLVCQDPHSHTFVQLGIVAWGLGCGDPIPAAYIDVPRYRRWIEEAMGSLDSSYVPNISEASPYQYEGDHQYQECYRAGRNYRYPVGHRCTKRRG